MAPTTSSAATSGPHGREQAEGLLSSCSPPPGAQTAPCGASIAGPERRFGDRLLYVEYHVSDEFDCGNVPCTPGIARHGATALFQGRGVILAPHPLINTIATRVNSTRARRPCLHHGLQPHAERYRKNRYGDLSLDSTVPRTTCTSSGRWWRKRAGQQRQSLSPGGYGPWSMALSGENLSQPSPSPLPA
jgi:hypothetical protein